MPTRSIGHPCEGRVLIVEIKSTLSTREAFRLTQAEHLFETAQAGPTPGYIVRIMKTPEYVGSNATIAYAGLGA